MFKIARNELYRLFLSPLAWVILGLVQVLLGYLFLIHMEAFSRVQAQISALTNAPNITELIAAPLLSNVATIILLICPFLTMRSFAEERANDTLSLLTSAPLSISEIVIGKFLGMMSFFLIMVLITLTMPLSLSIGSSLDYYQLSACVLGLILLIASFTAVGIFFSSLTRHPIIAAISTFAFLFLLWIIDWSTQFQGGYSSLKWLSLINHFEPMIKGQVNTEDLSFFIIVTVSFILLTIRRLDRERLAS